MNYIYWFQDISASQFNQVGGKGANLGELTRAGLPVPPGFCVAASAYQDYLKATNLDQVIEAVLAEIKMDDRLDVERKSAQIRDSISDQPILPEIVSQVIDSYHQLLLENEDHLHPGISLAVRSSATFEDQPRASFAGQLATYLNVHGEARLLEHVKKCWISLWTDRVVPYITRRGLDHREVSMSVVVQAMIPSEVSGSLFTVNPVTGDFDEVVINASLGLGEAIVSSFVSPDTIIVRKCNGQIISRQIGANRLMVRSAIDGGTEEIPVPETMRTSSALADEQVIELLDLGKRIEAHYGKPQDIDWGYCDERFYLFQSQPMTTLSVQSERICLKGDFNRTMFIEIFPDPVSPVFLSVIKYLLKEMLDFTFKSLGFNPPDDILAIGIFFNQVYFNCDYITAAYRPLSPAVRQPLMAHAVNPFEHRAETINFEPSRPFLRMMARIIQFIVRSPKQLPNLLVTYQAEISEVESYPLESAEVVDIVALIRRVLHEYTSKLLNYDYLMIEVIGITYRLLGATLKIYYGVDTDEVVAKLISGIAGNVVMETNKRIWDLAQIVKSSWEVSQILRQGSYKERRELLEGYPEGHAFLGSLDRFLVGYGHRGLRMDILDLTWRDHPEPILSFIRNYLDADEDQNPHRQQARLAKEREQLIRFLLNDIHKGLLGGLLIAPMFRWILKQAQIYSCEREPIHFELMRIFPLLRRMFLELGRRWAASGVLDQEEDIFFLTIDEIQEIAQVPRTMQQAVLARKDEYATNQTRSCPNIIRNGEEIYSQDIQSGGSQGKTLQALPGSTRKSVGFFRIIINFRKVQQAVKRRFRWCNKLAHRLLLSLIFITCLAAAIFFAGWDFYWGGFPQILGQKGFSH